MAAAVSRVMRQWVEEPAVLIKQGIFLVPTQRWDQRVPALRIESVGWLEVQVKRESRAGLPKLNHKPRSLCGVVSAAHIHGEFIMVPGTKYRLPCGGGEIGHKSGLIIDLTNTESVSSFAFPLTEVVVDV